MENYTYRLLTIEDSPAIYMLFEAAFNTPPKERFIQWKYFDNPAGNAILAGAFIDNQLVGSGAMIPEMMSVFGKEKLIFKCTDLMTHPAHQRKGLSKKVNELLYQETLKRDTPFSYTLCSKTATKSFLKNNWLYLGGVINLFKPYLLLRVSSVFRQSSLATIKVYGAVGKVLNNYPFCADSGYISILKWAEYLRWRTSNPNFYYQIICANDEQGKVSGYLICSSSTNNLLNIIDMEATDGNVAILKQLLSYAEDIAIANKNKGILSITIHNSPVFKFLKKESYLHNPFDKGPLKAMLDFDIYLYDTEQTAIKDTRHWDISALSYDDI